MVGIQVDEVKEGIFSFLATAIPYIDYGIISLKLYARKLKCPQTKSNWRHKNKSQMFVGVDLETLKKKSEGINMIWPIPE